MLIRLDKFTGIAPKFEPHLLPTNAAVVANNCKLVSGAIRPWRNPLFVSTPSKAGVKLSIFDYGGFWFHWITDVDTVRGPLAQDAWDRVYFTGDGAPKMTANAVATAGGGTGYPTNSYALGIPAPTGAAAVIAAGASTSEDPLDYEDRAYVYTFVSAYGEEGPPSPPSPVLTWAPGQTVEVSGIDAPPAEALNITQKKIYRTNTGSSGTEYQLVGAVAAAVSSFTDDVDSEDLSIVLPSAEWDAPPDDLKGLGVHPSGALFGFSGKELCFSEPYRPHAWPVRYRVPVDTPIVAAGAFGASILVATQGMPYLVTGGEPGGMSPEKFELGHACVSKRGLVDMGYAVAYPAPEGLAVVGISRMELATDKIMSRDEWQAYKPESIHAYLYAGRYVGFYDTGTKQAGFVFDPETGDFSDIDLYATAGFSHPATGDLYLVVDGDIVKWDAGATPMVYQWKARPYRAPGPSNLGAGQVFADTYPVTLKVYADGVLKHTQAVSSNLPFRLPSGFVAQDWQAEVLGSASVNTVLLATTITELGATA